MALAVCVCGVLGRKQNVEKEETMILMRGAPLSRCGIWGMVYVMGSGAGAYILEH
jgi:hypothetical protein